MKLYEISNDLLAALEAAYEAADDQTGVVSLEFMERVHAIQLQFESKAENICKMLADMLDRCDACKREEVRLAGQRKTVEANAEWLKGYLKSEMERLGMDKLTAGTYRLAIRKNGQAALTIDESELGIEHWMQPPPVPDKEGIRAALAAGVPVKGAVLTTGTHLRIT